MWEKIKPFKIKPFGIFLAVFVMLVVMLSHVDKMWINLF